MSCVYEILHVRITRDVYLGEMRELLHITLSTAVVVKMYTSITLT